MKCLSCTALPKLSEDLPDCHSIPLDSPKDQTNVADRIRAKGNKMQTLVEVLRCDLARPGKTSLEDPWGPTKQWTPLYYAVHQNRELALLHFLRTGQSADGNLDTSQPPLCLAVASGHIDLVSLLCEFGANVKAPMKHNGETPLHIAVRTGRNDIMDVLLPYHPILDARTSDTGETPLHYAAAKSGSLAVVVALLKSGASYEALNLRVQSPGEVALQSHNLNAAVAIIGAARGKRRKLIKEKEMLLKHVEKAQSRFSMNNELIADIFEAGCPSDSTVLIEAIKRDDVGLVEMFVEKGAPTNRQNQHGIYPIFAALNCAGAKVVQALVKHGADVRLRDSHGLTVLQAAFECPSAHDKEAISAISEALLSNGADALVKYPDGTSLLHRVVKPDLGLAKVAQQLIEHGVNIDEQDKHGNSALHTAYSSKSCFTVLLKNRANPKILNKDGLTPLLYALTNSNKGQEPHLEPLIQVSDLRAVDRNGRTALHIAAQHGLEKNVRWLLQARAETTSVNVQKHTPLLLAAIHHQWSLIPLLVSQPGINSWDEEGRTALHRIVMSTPQAPSTWKDVAGAIAPFCRKGVSRSMRDKTGATPLIQAVKTLPDEGVLVIEALLGQTGMDKANCVGHEDHKGKDALYFAATLGKPNFVQTVLQHGASVNLKDWKPSSGIIHANSAANKKILRSLAEHEWHRRAISVFKESSTTSEEPVLPHVLPVSDIKQLFHMGLDANYALKTRTASSVLWVILNQISASPKPPAKYMYDVLKLVLNSGADPNALTTREMPRLPAKDALSGPSSAHSRNSPPRLSPQTSMPRLSQSPSSARLSQSPSNPTLRHSSMPVKAPLPLSMRRSSEQMHSPSSCLEKPNPSYLRLSRSPSPRVMSHGSLPPTPVDSTRPSPRPSPGPVLAVHALSFLLEQNGSTDIDLINLFIDNGAKLNVASPFYGGRLPLHSATDANRLDIVDEFLTRRADVNAADVKGRTALHIAAEKGHWEIVELMIRFKSKVDVKDMEGNTPLHAAVAAGCKRIVSCLLRVGAKPLETNKKGLTPLASLPEMPTGPDMERIVQLLKYTEEQHLRDAERKARELERQAVFEKRQRQFEHRQREEADRRHRIECERREREERERQQCLEQTKKTEPAPATNYFPHATAQSIKTALSGTTTQSTKNVVNVHLQPVDPVKKSDLPTRVDSGVLMRSPAIQEKELPPLDKHQTTFDTKEKVGGEELADWLALTRILDRI